MFGNPFWKNACPIRWSIALLPVTNAATPQAAMRNLKGLEIPDKGSTIQVTNLWSCCLLGVA
eukprot:4310005-Amphidinium_carterae.1